MVRPSNRSHFLTPPAFHGKKVDASRWIDKFRRYAENKRLEDRTKINDFFHLLEGSAYDYCSSLSDEPKTTWETLEEAFQQKICKKRNKVEVQQELMESKQKKDESLEEYITRLENKGLRDGISEDVIFSAIMQGMDRALRVIVAQRNPMNLQELSAFADQAESVKKMQVKNEKEKEIDDKFDKLTAMLEKMSVNAKDAQKEQRGRGGKSDKEDCPRCGE